MKYAYVQANAGFHSIRRQCRILNIHPSGFYAWKKKPHSKRYYEDQRLTGLIKQFWLESGSVYGYRKIHEDLLSVGEFCGKHKVARLMKQAGIKAEIGYKRKPHMKPGPPSHIAPNLLEQKFSYARPNQAWVTDITYIKTAEGWLFLAIVLDLFSRQVIGWSMKNRMETDIVISALMMAVWRRNPKQPVTIHSDQGSQYTSYDWQSFLKQHNLIASHSRRGNCYDNAVAESFFQLLKRERIKRRVYRTRDEAKADIFDYIEMFYNPKRRHGNNQNLSPVEYEKSYIMKVKSV